MSARPPARRAGPTVILVAVMAGGCAGRTLEPATPTPAQPPVPADAVSVASATVEPLLPPEAARLLGLMPRRTVGAEQFLAEHPSYDGRGVLIAILDSGIDPGLPGLHTTTTGTPKVLDIRDFSGEGRVALRPVTPVGDIVSVGGVRLRGFGRVRGLATGTTFGGVLLERHLGASPGADLNGDGDVDDTLAFIVAKASDGWFVIADGDGDGSLAGEDPVRDYGHAGETLAFGPVTIAVNLPAGGAAPELDLVFDTSGHGTHVAGIAAGHNMFEVAGFDGIAPGAQLLGLKIANDARGGISVTGSMVRAMTYAATFAAGRGMPLVINLSFGIGNEDGAGPPVIDSLIDAFALEHPEVVVVISAGNDGPGVSTLGFPGSAGYALSACALFPGVFAQAPVGGTPPADDVLGWWSARGGLFAKPDVCVPGVAFSNVPAWQTGEEVSGGTSMAAPQLAGIVALLQSGTAAHGQVVDAATIAAALRATAVPIPGATWIDAGAGVPQVRSALAWLRAGHRAGRFRIRALQDGGNTGIGAAYRRNGIAVADTLQRFTVTSDAGQPFAQLQLQSDATWLRSPPKVEFAGRPVTIPVTYDTRGLQAPGLYVGSVWARPTSDTTAGAAFGLTSTIVVPYTLNAPLHSRQYVAKGRSARFFLTVPDGAAGLAIRVRVPDGEQAASLYLFEPSGRPQRTESSLEIGGAFPATGQILVQAEDIVPGVYEAVLVAPPTRSVTVEFDAELSMLTMGRRSGTGLELVNRHAVDLPATVTLQTIGAGEQFHLHGGSRVSARHRLHIPDWATRIRIDVAFPPERWQAVTDVGVTLWDTSGYFVNEGPLNYAFGRQVIPVTPETPRVLDLEVMPGFAQPDDPSGWEADVTVAYLAEHPLSPDHARPITFLAGDTVRIDWPVDTLTWLPPGLLPVREASVLMADRATTVLQALEGRPQEAAR